MQAKIIIVLNLQPNPQINIMRDASDRSEPIRIANFEKYLLYSLHVAYRARSEIKFDHRNSTDVFLYRTNKSILQ